MMIFRVIGRMVMRMLEGIGRSAIRHPLGTLIFLLIVGLLSAALYFTASIPSINVFGSATDECGLPASVSSDAKDVQPSAELHPSAAGIINGVASYNASKIWENLSSCYQNDLQKIGVSQQVLQQRLDGLRDQTKLSLTGIVPQGTLQFSDGRSISGANAYVQIAKDTSKPVTGDNIMTTTTDINTYINREGKAYKVESSSFYIANLFKALLAQTTEDDCGQVSTGNSGQDKNGTTDRNRNPAADDYLSVPSSVTNFLNGMGTFNAKDAWAGLSRCFQKQLEGTGTTVDVLQQRLNTLRNTLHVTTLGYNVKDAVKFPNGRGAYQFYSYNQIEAKADDGSFSSLNSKADPQVIIVYTNQAGKIYLISSQDPILNALFSDPVV